MRKLGPVSKKILLLLEGGLALSLTRRPDIYFSVAKNIAKEWRKINERSLREAIKNLYKSKMIDYKENDNGTINIVLSEGGRNKILRYDLDKIMLIVPLSFSL